MEGTKKPYSVKLNMHDVNKLDKISKVKGVPRAKLIDLAIKRLIKDIEESK